MTLGCLRNFLAKRLRRLTICLLDCWPCKCSCQQKRVAAYSLPAPGPVTIKAVHPVEAANASERIDFVSVEVIVRKESSCVMAVEALLPASAVAKMNGNCTGLVSSDSAVLIDVGENSDSATAKKFPKEPKKFLISIGLLMFAGMTNDIVLAWIHERVPETAPLPDLFFSLTPHRHRWILLRRVFCMLALLYLSRCVCMLVTQVPVADPTYFCSPKSNNTDFGDVLMRALRLFSGAGLNIFGKHTFCGDYIFSGHTLILVMSYMVVKEYSPRRFWQLHIVVWLVSASGILCILLSRGHYTVDVVIAYFVTTRMFWLYHTMANNPELKEYTPTNLLSRDCWFPLFRYMESNVAPSVPRQFEWPFPWPRFLKSASISNGGRFRS